jgi:hypothetical protein
MEQMNENEKKNDSQNCGCRAAVGKRKGRWVEMEN